MPLSGATSPSTAELAIVSRCNFKTVAALFSAETPDHLWPNSAECAWERPRASSRNAQIRGKCAPRRHATVTDFPRNMVGGGGSLWRASLSCRSLHNRDSTGKSDNTVRATVSSSTAIREYRQDFPRFETGIKLRRIRPFPTVSRRLDGTKDLAEIELAISCPLQVNAQQVAEHQRRQGWIQGH